MQRLRDGTLSLCVIPRDPPPPPVSSLLLLLCRLSATMSRSKPGREPGRDAYVRHVPRLFVFRGAYLRVEDLYLRV